MVEPVALLHQRETCTYGPISPPLTGSVGTRERKLQVSLLCKLHSEYGGLTVKVVVEHKRKVTGATQRIQGTNPANFRTEAKSKSLNLFDWFDLGCPNSISVTVEANSG